MHATVTRVLDKGNIERVARPKRAEFSVHRSSPKVHLLTTKQYNATRNGTALKICEPNLSVGSSVRNNVAK
jgi:hypothetical protein